MMRLASLSLLVTLLLSVDLPSYSVTCLWVTQIDGVGAGSTMPLTLNTLNTVPWMSRAGSRIQATVVLDGIEVPWEMEVRGITATYIRVAFGDDWIACRSMDPDIDGDGDVDMVDFGKIQALDYPPAVREWAAKQVTGAKQ